MPVASAHRIGPFEVIAPLGAGGMGEVFRARDPRIGREVAIKVLPADYARDPNRLRRFEQEARAAGSLSHPNLVTIFELGTHDGSPYIAMELLEGAPLREKLRGRGAEIAASLPPRKAVEIAIQIASGLAAAHEKGLVHRDLKPENVFVTTDGFAKILDFGIVKLAAPAVTTDSQMPTTPKTSPGLVIGTAGYMAPEQVSGAPVDHRSDIFSLGAVLYEMLSGRRAFHAPTTVETMNAILNEDPPPLSGEGSRISPALERIVRRCLEKEPRQRFDSAHDLVFALEAIGDTSGTGSREHLDVPVRRRRTRALIGVALAAGAAIGLAGFWLGRETTRSAPAPARRIGELVRLTWEPGHDAHPTVSPDGASFAFARGPRGGEADIFLRRIGGENAINLTPDSPGEDTMPSFSPDGTLIAFRSSRDGGGIFLMGATGESVRRLTDFGFEPAWSPDGTSIAFATDRSDTGAAARNSEIWIVEVATGKRRKLFEGDGVHPSWSPSGTRLAFFDRTRPGVVTIASSGGPVSALTEAYALTPEWTRDGIVFASLGHDLTELWRANADDATGAATGQPEPLVQSTTGPWMPASTPDGRRLLFTSTQNTFTVIEHAFDPARGILLPQERTLHSTSRELRFLLASPDKEWLCFLLFEEGRQDLILVNTRRSETRRLTDDALREQATAWSSDGSKIYFFLTFEDARGEIWSIAPDGSGRELELRVAGPSLQGPVLAPDGRAMYVFRADTREAFAVDLTLPVAERTLVPLPRPEEGKHLSLLEVSPDGRSIIGFAASKNGELDRVLWLFDVKSRTYRKVTDLKVAHSFQWLPDSKRVLLGRRGDFRILDVRTGAIAFAGKVDGSAYLSTDGRSLFTRTWQQESDIWMLDYGDEGPANTVGTTPP